MKEKSALQRLSYKIAEEVAELFTSPVMHSADVSTEDIYRVVWRTMPLDKEGWAEEQEAFDRSINKVIPKQTGPTLLQRLRWAVHADKGAPLKVVLEAAIQKCRAINKGDIE